MQLIEQPRRGCTGHCSNMVLTIYIHAVPGPKQQAIGHMKDSWIHVHQNV